MPALLFVGALAAAGVAGVAVAALARTRWAMPVQTGAIGSGYGLRRDPFGSGGWKWHDGLDFPAREGEPVFPVAPGRVTFAGENPERPNNGLHVVVQHDDGTATWYLHLSLVTTARGANVKPGMPLGLVGSTGRSTGAHLHLQAYAPDGRTTFDPAWRLGPDVYVRALVRGGPLGGPDAELVQGIGTFALAGAFLGQLVAAWFGARHVRKVVREELAGVAGRVRAHETACATLRAAGAQEELRHGG